jgi:hypothetical protein
MKKLMVIVVIVLCIGIVGATHYQQETIVDLTMACGDVNCSDNNNITIFYPNTSKLIDNRLMSIGKGFANYTLTATQTNITGEYLVYVDGDGETDYHDSFVISAHGEEVSTAAAETITRGIYVLLVIAILFFIGFYWNKEPVWKWTFFLLGIMFLIVTLNLVSISIHNYSLETDVFNVFDKIGAISYYMIWFVGGLLLMIWILKVLATLAERRNMAAAQRVGSPLNLGGN